ncbi:hypothetical protein MUK42_07019 [Musa troglodytarum]|uniref:Uncharacterized protein n=1 Tax=Musa troglodytarum TaxID=320322 RepID=A0A9E7L811_9LILI|nr:hypothetical protein MUK42_07019 [Musa troglodytarum]
MAAMLASNGKGAETGGIGHDMVGRTSRATDLCFPSVFPDFVFQLQMNMNNHCLHALLLIPTAMQQLINASLQHEHEQPLFACTVPDAPGHLQSREVLNNSPELCLLCHDLWHMHIADM